MIMLLSRFAAACVLLLGLHLPLMAYQATKSDHTQAFLDAFAQSLVQRLKENKVDPETHFFVNASGQDREKIAATVIEVLRKSKFRADRFESYRVKGKQVTFRILNRPEGTKARLAITDPYFDATMEDDFKKPIRKCFDEFEEERIGDILDSSAIHNAAISIVNPSIVAAVSKNGTDNSAITKAQEINVDMALAIRDHKVDNSVEFRDGYFRAIEISKQYLEDLGDPSSKPRYNENFGVRLVPVDVKDGEIFLSKKEGCIVHTVRNGTAFCRIPEDQDFYIEMSFRTDKRFSESSLFHAEVCVDGENICLPLEEPQVSAARVLPVTFALDVSQLPEGKGAFRLMWATEKEDQMWEFSTFNLKEKVSGNDVRRISRMVDDISHSGNIHIRIFAADVGRNRREDRGPVAASLVKGSVLAALGKARQDTVAINYPEGAILDFNLEFSKLED